MSDISALVTRPRLRAGLGLAVSVAVVLASLVFPGSTAPAVQINQPGLVSADPESWSPDVMDGRVYSIEQVGDLMVVGGTFTQVKEKGQKKPVLDRSGLFAFNARTGAISESFAPTLNNPEVYVVKAAGDGSVFVGGRFAVVNGTSATKLTRLRVSDGSIVAGFAPPALTNVVKDVRVVGGQLIVAGSFVSVGGDSTRAFLTSLSAATGKVSGFLHSSVSVPRQGSVSVDKIDVTPDGKRLIAIGNFSVVDGLSRRQLVMFDLSRSVARVADWATRFYALNQCAKGAWTYMRDLDIDPGGRYFVVTTTGGYRGSESPCDVAARFEIKGSGTSIDPTWRAYTGGDTFYAVAITGSVVYVGGHMRWMNNPWAGEEVGNGAVERSGIAALDPKSGIPLSWNPGRKPRGVGVFDMLATDRGLWIGSDTDWVANEQHRKLAFFPLAGGKALPTDRVGSLTNDVYLVGQPGSDKDVMRRQRLTTWAAAGALDTTRSGINGPSDLSSVRGATLISGTVFTAWSDGSFLAHPLDGASLGAPKAVDLHGSKSLPGAAEWFGSDAAKLSGLFYEPKDKRLYYTMSGDTHLYWRGFSTESRVIGGAKFSAEGDVAALAPDKIKGMFLANGHIYFSRGSAGWLRRVAFNRGVVSGPSEVVDTSIDWRSRGAFLGNKTVPKPFVTITVKTRKSGGVLRVNVDPNLGPKAWELRIKKKISAGSWQRLKQTYKTQGSREVRTIDLKKGRYKVIVPASRGYRNTESAAVTLKR